MPRLLVNTFGDRYYRKERKLPVEEEFCWTHSEVVRIQLPEGLDATYVPASAAQTVDGRGYSLDCTTVPSSAGAPAAVIFHNSFHIDRLMLGAAELPAWRTMLDQLDRDINRTIVLKQPTR
jgi:hypothetical protein